MDLLIAAVGWLGAGLLLLAYGLVSAGRLRTEKASFQVLNLVGAVALVANSGYHGAWPSVVLNLAWIGIGLAAMTRRTLQKPSASSAEEVQAAGGVGQRADQHTRSGLRP